jgi:hypothetical protein
MLTNGLRRAAPSRTDAWQLEDDGYVLPRPRATAVATPGRVVPQPSAVPSRSPTACAASGFKAEAPASESRT